MVCLQIYRYKISAYKYTSIKKLPKMQVRTLYLDIEQENERVTMN